MNNIAMNNKLTFQDILKESKKYDQFKKVTFKNGKWTEIYTNISNVKIQEMLNSFFSFINQLQRFRQIEGKQVNDSELLDFLNLHIVLHFTTLAIEIPEGIAEKVDLFEQIMKHDVLEECFESFEKSDIEKIYSRFYKLMEMTQDMIKNNEKYRTMFKEKIKEMDLENREIIEELYGIKEEGDTEVTNRGE